MEILRHILLSKELKPKEKIEKIALSLSLNELTTKELIHFTLNCKIPEKASCIEALELVTKGNSSFLDKSEFKFVVDSLSDEAPRIKWESAKVIANTAISHQNDLNKAISQLLLHTEHKGTVVRWSAALALGEIIKLNTKHNQTLIPAIQQCMSNEEKNSIKKIYALALKKSKA